MRKIFKISGLLALVVFAISAIALFVYNLRPVDIKSKAFELDGLDKTNSNARPRGILIHAGVGPLSWGCISLPFTRYAQLSGILEELPKNVIVWAYD